MTIFEFFYNQTTKQIKECFRKAGIEKYVDVPENQHDFCDVFGLEQDNRIRYSYSHNADYQGSMYVYFSMPNTIFPANQIMFDVHYHIRSCKNACSVSLTSVFGYYKDCEFFSEVSDIYDARPDYNNIVCKIDLPGLKSFFGWEAEIDKNTTLAHIYDAVIEYAQTIKPYIDAFVQSTKDGSFEKIWNTYSPKDPFVRGDSIFKGFVITSHIKSWMLIERSGHKMSLDEFVLLNVATEKKALGNRTGEVYSEDIETRVKACLDLIDAYKNNYVKDTSFNDWCELYEKAYHKMRKRYAEEREKISKELGINQKYVGVFCKQWPQNYVPEDAYDLDWRDEKWKE